MRALAAPALFLAAGLPLTAALARVRGRLALRLGWAYVLGVAYVGVALYALSHVAAVPLRRAPIGAVAAAPAAVLLLLHLAGRRERASRSVLPRASAPARVAGVLGAAVCLAVLAETSTNPFAGWDDRATWVAHARHVRAAGSVDAPAFRDAWIAIEHPRYPALLAVAHTALAEVFATDDERVARGLHGAALAAFLLILFGEARARAGEVPAALAVACASLLPMLTFEGDGGAVSGYADLPLGLFWGGAVLLLSGRPRGEGSAALAALLLAAAVLTKDEGLPIALAALLALSPRPLRVLVRAARRRRSCVRRLLVRMAVPALGIVFAAVLLALWRAAIPVRLEPNFDPRLHAGRLLTGIVRRYPLLFVAMLKEMQRPDRWGLFFLTAPAVAALGRRALRRRSVSGPALAVAGALAVYGLAYAATRLNPFSMVLVTWSRFLLQVGLVLLVVFAATLGEALRRPRGGLLLVPAIALGLFTPAARLLDVRFAYSDVGLAPSKETALSPEPPSVPAGLPRPVAAGADDPTLPAAIDEPSEGAPVRAPLVVRGWSQTEGARGELLSIALDGARAAPSSFARVPRPDVARALPRLGACEAAGFEARFDALALAPGDHVLTVRFVSGARQRALTRRFTGSR